MTETAETLASEASDERRDEQDDQNAAILLMCVVVTLLAPIYRSAAGGDMHLARMAAFETVKQYHPRNHVDLIIIAQIIGCSLAGVGSVGLAAMPNLSAVMIMRLRANAAAMFRVAEQARRALLQFSARVEQPSKPEPVFVPDPNQAANEERLIAEIAATKIRATEALIRLGDIPPPPAPAPAPHPPAAVPPVTNTPAQTATAQTATAQTATVQTTTPQQQSDAAWQARFASLMDNETQKFTDNLKNRSPSERLLAIQQAETMASIAKSQLSASLPPEINSGADDPYLPT
jgi:hypothetical protein